METPKRSTPGMTVLFPDQPVREGPVSFKFEGFARTLAELALNPDNHPPFTIAIKGDWGRGKTTLLEATRRILKDEGTNERADAGGHRRVKTLWLNAWKYPQEDTILAGLLGALLDEIRSGDLIDQLKLFIEAHKDVRPLLRAAAPWLPWAKEVADLFETDRFDEIHKRRAFHDHFRELFGQLSYVWVNGWGTGRDNFGKSLKGTTDKAVVAVFLDDLDRCRESRVLETLEAINLFLDLDGVCFYLGLNWQRVREILEAATGGRQEHFLEKIVQVEIDLPEVAEEGAGEYLSSLVQSTALGAMFDEAAGEAVSRVLKRRDPRHVKRFLNDLAIRLGVLRHTGNLGASDEQVTQEAVLSWHLLHEALSDAAWASLTRHRGNLEGFLNRYQSVREMRQEREKNAARPESVNEEEFAVFQTDRMLEYLDRLRGLSPVQRDLLVHLGSPPRQEVRARAARAGQTGRFELDLGGPWWVSIPAGSFRMGSKDGESDERPVRTADVSAYRMSRHPVTNRQYQLYASETGAPVPQHWPDGKVPEGKEDHPVVFVSWLDAEAFCTWLSGKLTEEVRLPTEAEWEHAARGNGGRTYPWGGDEAPTPAHANFGGNVGDTTPVGSYPKGATPEGVHDLAGNVWDWCRDWYGPYSDRDEQDPTGPTQGNRRVVRGGSFSSYPRDLRGAYRSGRAPDDFRGLIGCRCVVGSAGGQIK